MASSPVLAFYAGIKPDPYIDYVEWANEHFRLTKESSVEPGKYRTSRTPWVEEILRELSPQSSTQEVVVIKPTQFGFTTLANIMLCCIAHRYPGPAMLVQPTDDMVKRHSKKKLAPTVRDVPCLQGIIQPTKSRDAGNTLLLKEFPGGSWTLTGSNSPVSARSDSIRYLILDDYDGFTQDAGGEGEPGDLFKNRTDAFGNKKKIYINSTPTLKRTSHIEKEWEDSSQGHFNVPCPHCGEMQFLKFGGPDTEFGIKFARDDDGQIVDVWYICQHCQARIDEWQKTEMLANGEYIHKYPNRKKRGFKINSQYSPLGWLSWTTIAEEFLKAAKALQRGDSKKMKKWVNTRQAEAWEEKITLIKNTNEEILKCKCDLRPHSVPESAVALTCGIDVQKNGFWYSVRAWASDYTSWNIDHGFLPIWDDIERLLFETQYPIVDSDNSMRIWRAGIDTGGGKYSDISSTEEVYLWLQDHVGYAGGCRVWGMKGSSRPLPTKIKLGNVLNRTPSGRALKMGMRLIFADTNKGKDLFFDRMGKARDGLIGGAWLHSETGIDYSAQITAEQKQDDGKGNESWVQIGRRDNHLLDCEYMSCLLADWEWPGGGVNLLTNPVNIIRKKQKKSDKKQTVNPFTGGQALFGG